MAQIRAEIINKTKPELGVVTVPFPIPRQEYDYTLEMLRSLEIGTPLDRDCCVETLYSSYPVLERLEGTTVNLDELDYLAKRLESFDVSETAQFQGAAAAKGISDIQGFINLTFCCQQVTVVQDFKDLTQIGKDHLMALNGGCVSEEEWGTTNFRKRALVLLQTETGRITPYGVVYENGMEMTRLYYQGCPFPDYWCGEPLVAAVGTKENERFLFLPMAESRLRRELERYPILLESLPIAYIDQAEPKEIASSLALEKEDIFSLNRLAEALDGLSPAEMEKLKAAMFLTEPSSSGEIISLVNKLDRMEITLKPEPVQNLEPTTLKLYMPLTADCYDEEYGEEEKLDGFDLAYYRRSRGLSGFCSHRYALYHSHREF